MHMYEFLSSTMSCSLLLGFAILGPAGECGSACNLDNGLYENGKCRCRPGWQGETCEQCIPYPSCVHGTCEKAWQCMCEQGWMGSRCDQDIRLCLSMPCSGNSTCIETGEGGYLCICSPGYTGRNCQLKKGPCLINGSPCQNGGTCVDNNGFDDRCSCLCPLGFTGYFCEINIDNCEPNPCLNGGTCTDLKLAYTCNCPPGFSGPMCNISHALCSDRNCGKGGTCLNEAGSRARCVCPPGLAGPLCGVHKNKLKPKARSKYLSTGHHPQHYRLSAHTFNKMLKSPEHELLKITMKETAHASNPLDTRSQVICFAILGLLTCLVVMGTTGIIFFNRCETWLANAKYRQLVRQQRDNLLKTNSEEHCANIILPEKIKLNKYGKHYTSI